MLESGMSALARALRGDLGLDDDDYMITAVISSAWGSRRTTTRRS
jgi:hypothetical protein